MQTYFVWRMGYSVLSFFPPWESVHIGLHTYDALLSKYNVSIINHAIMIVVSCCSTFISGNCPRYVSKVSSDPSTSF